MIARVLRGLNMANITLGNTRRAVTREGGSTVYSFGVNNGGKREVAGEKGK